MEKQTLNIGVKKESRNEVRRSLFNTDICNAEEPLSSSRGIRSTRLHQRSSQKEPIVEQDSTKLADLK